MTETKPLVSVIMSVRNGEEYLGKAVESILKQSYRHFEFIIIDDASSDRTVLILKSFKDRRIKIIANKSKKGLTRSLNLALKKTRGDFIARMDADDVSRPLRLEKQVNYLIRHPKVGVVGSSFELIDKDGRKIGVKKFPSSSTEISRSIFRFNPLRHPTVMFRKKLVETFGDYDCRLDGAEDYDLWLRYGKHTKMVNLKDRLLQYRLHKKSVSVKEEKKVLLSAIRARYKAIVKYHYSLTNLIYLLIALLSYFVPSRLKRMIK